jgi:phosphopantothenoylcysteine decarboxylase/phosphopantothenate--cysteine ligase
MDEDMWKHPSTQTNIAVVQSFGNTLIPVENGPLASGLVGEGRMAEPEVILRKIQDHFFFKQDLKGKKALVTAGPTHEAIDPVRFIANHSSGKMGVAIARELAARGATVDLVLGPVSFQVKEPRITVHPVVSAQEMYEDSVKIFPDADIAVMAAAVADYKTAQVSSEKIKKKADEFSLNLVKTKDILLQLGRVKRENQVLAGFALENHNERAYAIEKLKNKKADLIVLNSMNDGGAGFGFDSNKITIFEKNGAVHEYEQKSKILVAKDIVDRIVSLIYG